MNKFFGSRERYQKEVAKWQMAHNKRLGQEEAAIIRAQYEAMECDREP